MRKRHRSQRWRWRFERLGIIEQFERFEQFEQFVGRNGRGLSWQSSIVSHIRQIMCRCGRLHHRVSHGQLLRNAHRHWHEGCRSISVFGSRNDMPNAISRLWVRAIAHDDRGWQDVDERYLDSGGLYEWAMHDVFALKAQMRHRPRRTTRMTFFPNKSGLTGDPMASDAPAETSWVIFCGTRPEAQTIVLICGALDRNSANKRAA